MTDAIEKIRAWQAKVDAQSAPGQQVDLSEKWLALVTRNGVALKSVPQPLRTYELCMAAVTQSGSAIKSVPKKLRTPEICMAAVSQDGNALEHVPERAHIGELYLAAVTQSGGALQYVPEPLRTPELCLVAVKQNIEAFRFVPLAALEREGGEVLTEWVVDNLDRITEAEGVDSARKWARAVSERMEAVESVSAQRERGG